MTCNVGPADKGIRIGLGIFAIGVGLLAPIGAVGRVIAFVVAVAALVTAFSGF
jgi:hypothetical protein